MKVHGTMGSGYRELIYSRCLAIELAEAGLKFQREFEWPIYYRDILVGKKRIDFLVEDKICVELKAISELTDKELECGLNPIIWKSACY